MYTKNPFLPRVRMEAVNLVRLRGWGVRQVARHLSVSPGTISKWLGKALRKGSQGIPTISSRPHTHPNQISQKLEDMIIHERERHNRCGQVVYETLRQKGVEVSLSTVHRVLDRNGLTKKWSKWKRRHSSSPRPSVIIPGDLVELDTIHIALSQYRRFYVYTLIDVATRWAYAKVSLRITAGRSLIFVSEARRLVWFPFSTLQSDHGPEFSSWFTGHVGSNHRHTRIRKPNDNAHIERFNRIIQEECLKRLPTDPKIYMKEIPEYLRYYNTERLHMGLNCKTPVEKLAELFPRS